MITNEIYFFKNQSSVSTSGPLYNVNDGTLILQVDGDVSNLELLVLGNTDLVDDDFVTLKTINASDYNMSDKITSTGIYWIDINGIRKIKLNLSKITGSVNVKAITKRGLTTDLVARAMAANSAGGGSYTLPVASASTLGGIKVGENLTIDENGVLSASGGTEVLPIYNVECDISNGPSPNWYDSSSDFAVLTKKAINEAYNKGDLHFILNYGSSSNNLGTTLQVVVKIYDTNRPIAFDTIPEISYMGGTYKKQLIKLDYGSWVYDNGEWTYTTDNVGAQFVSDSPFMTDSSALSTFLSKTNTKSYTPTSNYNPATKKYVDDAVASAGGGNNIYKMYISIYSNSLLAADANSSTLFLTSYADEFTKFINSIGDGNGALLYLYGSLSSSSPSYYMVPQGYIFTLASEGKSIVNKTTIEFVSSYVVTDAITKLDNRAAAKIYTLNINGTWTDNVFTCTSAAIYISTRFLLPTNNTTDYTPTSDYNPATKKYVDDTIASAITTSLEGSY